MRTTTHGWSLVAGSLCLALSLFTGGVARAQLGAGPTYLLVPPDETWRAEHWPVVVVAGEPGTALEDLAQRYGPLAAARGAGLVALQGGDPQRLDEALADVAARTAARLDAVLLLGRGTMAAWARELVLAFPTKYSGVIAIDDPGGVAELSDGAKQLVDKLQRAACLLVSDPAQLGLALKLHDQLLAQGLATAIEQVTPEQLVTRVGKALTALLPAPPSRLELFDRVTKATLKAPPGWEFVRSERFFALARPTDQSNDPVVEIATGGLGKRSFESYVEATRQALSVDGIMVLADERVTPAEAPVLVHRFYCLDTRAGRDRAVEWFQVGRGADLLSFRGIGSLEAVDARRDAVRELALGVRFEALAPAIATDPEPVDDQPPMETTAPGHE